MAKVITYSRRFPAHHSKKGQPTHFITKFWRSASNWPGLIWLKENNGEALASIDEELAHYFEHGGKVFPKKGHTIRAGHRFQPGDYFSPRVWSEGPYKSPMVKIAPDIMVEKTWDFRVDRDGDMWLNNVPLLWDKLLLIIKNDGLDEKDFLEWFKYPKEFDGQIICWDNTIIY